MAETAETAETAGPPTGDGSAAPAAPPLSKNQAKKQRRLERRKAAQAEKKLRRKEQKKEAQAARREEAHRKFEAMTPEEQKEYKLGAVQARRERMERKKEAQARRQDACASGQKVVLDLDFQGMMHEGECRSLAGQVVRCHAANKRSSTPFQLHLCSLGGTTLTQLQKMPGFEKWPVVRERRPYIEVFQGRRQDLVYLTADSENELTGLDPTKVYIVGGLVDRNRHKNVCRDTAERQGIATARLPIKKHVPMLTSAVLTTNHVVEMLLLFSESRDWRTALEQVIPERKRASPAAVPAGAAKKPKIVSVDPAGGGEAEEEAEEAEEGGERRRLI